MRPPSPRFYASSFLKKKCKWFVPLSATRAVISNNIEDSNQIIKYLPIRDLLLVDARHPLILKIHNVECRIFPHQTSLALAHVGPPPNVNEPRKQYFACDLHAQTLRLLVLLQSCFPVALKKTHVRRFAVYCSPVDFRWVARVGYKSMAKNGGKRGKLI